jgi:Arylsulfotransferase (ASST)
LHIRLAVRPLLVLLAALVVAGCAIGRASPATDVTSTAATLRGAVDSDRAQTVSWWFEYGTTAAYGNETQRRPLTFGGRSRTPVAEAVAGLEPDTTYHFRLCAQAPEFDVFCGDAQTFTTEPESAPTELDVSARPALYPAFDPGVSDYVTRCGSDPVEFDVEAPEGTQVSVDGTTARSGRFTENAQLASGERTAITVTAAGTQTFHVRCLPQNFPAWTYERTGDPSHGFTLVSVVVGISAQYLVFFDKRGVPVWWYRPTGGVLPIDAKLLSDDSVAFAEWGLNSFNSNPALKYQIRRLDGTLVRTLQTVGVPTDFHELQELSNGNYVLVAYKPRDHVDLSEYDESSDSTVLDAEIQELTPSGQLVWAWNSKDHIELEETGRWWSSLNPGTLPDGRPAIDHVHINAVEPDGDGLLISLRHTDAIYRISRTDGHVDWKLGGTDTPESLAVSDDRAPPATLGAQHDVRRLPDGTVSVFDNGTNLGRPPRMARFQIDPEAGSATLVESVTDAEITTSACCGGARSVDSNGWLIAWGGQPVVGEYDATGSRTSNLRIIGATLYRAVPVPSTRLGAERLRTAMDSMFPRSP